MENKEDQKVDKLASNYVCISNGKKSDVLYHSYNVLERSEFSFTTPNNGRILYFKALNNEHPRINKRENSMVLLMTSHRAEEKQVVSVIMITVEKKKLKPLFQIDPIYAIGCHPMVVRQKKSKRYNEPIFEFLLKLDEKKVFYSRNVCRDDWKLDLKLTHATFELDVPSKERQFVAMNFDSGPELVLNSRFIVMWRRESVYYFHICRLYYSGFAEGQSEGDKSNKVKLSPLPSEETLKKSGLFHPTEEFKSVPLSPSITNEFKFEAELSDKAGVRESVVGSFTEVMYNRSLHFIGVAGLFTTEDPLGSKTYKECFVKLLFLSFAFEDVLLSNMHIPPKMIISKNIQQAEDDGLNNYLICEKVTIIPDPAGHEPELQYAEGTFSYDNKDYYVIVYGVTRSSFLACCIVKKGKLDGELEFKNTQIDFEKHSTFLNKQSNTITSESNKMEMEKMIEEGEELEVRERKKPNIVNSNLIITAIGKDLDIDTRVTTKIKASFTVAVDPCTSFQIDIDFQKFLLQ